MAGQSYCLNMKLCCHVDFVLAVFVFSSYFLLATVSATGSSLKQQERASWMVNHGRLVKRDVSSNHTFNTANATQRQNLTTTGVPTVATTRRRPFFGWSTRRRNTASPVALDHMGFPIIPNGHHGTRRPRQPWTKQNTSNPTVKNSEQDRDGNVSHEIMGELRENGTQTSAFKRHSSTSKSTSSVRLSSKAPHTAGIEQPHNNRRNISSVIAKHSIWISIVASLLLSCLISLTVRWVRQRRRGKLMIATSGNKGQRSAAVVFKA